MIDRNGKTRRLVSAGFAIEIRKSDYRKCCKVTEYVVF